MIAETFAVISAAQSLAKMFGDYSSAERAKRKYREAEDEIRRGQNTALEGLRQSSDSAFSIGANAIAINANRNPALLGMLASKTQGQYADNFAKTKSAFAEQMAKLKISEPQDYNTAMGIAEGVGNTVQGYTAGKQLELSEKYVNWLIGKDKVIPNNSTTELVNNFSSSQPFNPITNPIGQNSVLVNNAPIVNSNTTATSLPQGMDDFDFMNLSSSEQRDYIRQSVNSNNFRNSGGVPNFTSEEPRYQSPLNFADLSARNNQSQFILFQDPVENDTINPYIYTIKNNNPNRRLSYSWNPLESQRLPKTRKTIMDWSE